MISDPGLPVSTYCSYLCDYMCTYPEPRLEWSMRSVRCVLCGIVELNRAGSRCALCCSTFTLQAGKFDFNPSGPLEESGGLGTFLFVRRHGAGADIVSPWFYVGMFT